MSKLGICKCGHFKSKHDHLGCTEIRCQDPNTNGCHEYKEKW